MPPVIVFSMRIGAVSVEPLPAGTIEAGFTVEGIPLDKATIELLRAQSGQLNEVSFGLLGEPRER